MCIICYYIQECESQAVGIRLMLSLIFCLARFFTFCLPIAGHNGNIKQGAI